MPFLSVVALGMLSCRFGFEPLGTDAGPVGNAPDASVVDAGPLIDADPNGIADAPPTVDCWDATWSERQRLTFDNRGQTESLIDFPVLVKLSASNFDYQQSQNSGQDLRFVDPDGTTLAHEIELWNEAGDSFVWVRAPQIDGASSSDYIWMHYGNSMVQDGQDPAGVWDTDHEGVWHLAETTGAHLDSAGGISCAWLGGGTGTQDAVGQIGGANDFDGMVDAADCGINQIADTENSTITAWVNLPLTGAADQEIVAIESLNGTFDGLGLYIRQADGALGKWQTDDYVYGALATSRISANQWSFVAIRGFGNNATGRLQVSTEGGPWETVASGDTSYLRIPNNTPLVLGKWTGGGPLAATRGRIDEIRISSVQRSDDWIRAQYLSSTGAFTSATIEPQRCP